MKRMYRAIAAVLCLSLCLGLCGCVQENALQDSTVVPDSTVSAETPEGVMDYAELQPQPFDSEAFFDRLLEAEKMLDTDAGAAAVIGEYYALTALLLECMTSYTLYDIACYTDVTDTALQQKSAVAYEKAVDCSDAYSVFLSNILKSRYREDYIAEVGEENALMYEDYEAMSEEQKELADREKALQDEYRLLAAEAYDSYEATAEVMAPLYVELVQLRNHIAETYGYDDYVTYAYENTYYRSYTPEQAAQLGEIVKEELAPLYVRSMLAESREDQEAFFRVSDTDEETLLALMQQYIPLMDSTLGSSLQHMLDTHSYNIAYSEKKHAASFTTMLYQYGVPFLFSQPEKESQPLSLGTLVHEFGHYHSFLVDPTYDTPDGYIYSLDDIDVAEISSTALELLFLEFYPELYGQDAAALQRGSVSGILSNVVFGCMFDEFQQIIYTTPDLQPQDISDIFHEVMLDYMGDIFVDDYSYHMWAVVNHNFEAPLYYVSYAMSALAAFQIWADAQADYDTALQAYLELAAYGTNVDFLELLEACGMRSVLDEGYLQELHGVLEPVLQP